MSLQLGRHLAIVGPFGSDVYVLSADDVRIRPGGGAYRAACGLLPFRAPALVLATRPRSFADSWLEKFQRSEIRIIAEPTTHERDDVEILDLRSATDRTLGQEVSSHGPVAPPTQVLEESPFRDLHVHLAGLPAGAGVELAREVLRIEPRASISTTLEARQLIRDPTSSLELAGLCQLVVVDDDPSRVLGEKGDLDGLLRERLVFVWRGAAGVLCLADGVPFFAHTPEPKEVVSEVGAADVFAGALLASLLDSRDLTRSVLLASEVAARSATDHGVEEVAKVRHEIGRLRPRDLLGIPRPPLALGSDRRAAPIPFDDVVEATGLFVVRDGRLLLVRKPDEKAFRPGLLYVPGGKREDGESFEECARRELREETGLEAGGLEDLGVFYYPHPRRAGCLYRFRQFWISDPAGEAVPHDDIVECAWCALDQIERRDVFDLTWAQLFLRRLLGPSTAAAHAP